MNISTVIFDLWDTLGTKNISISKTIAKKFGFEGNHEFQKKYETAVQLKKCDSLEKMSKTLLTYLGVPTTQESVDFTANVFQTGINNSVLFEGMEKLLKQLSKNYTLAILTNTTNLESGAPFKWGVADLFKEMVFSWQIGSLKPAEQNYRVILQKLNKHPEEAVFIDDTQENLLAAERLGMKAIRYESVQLLRSELLKLKI